ncbi:MAG TPA: DUF3352 domain-containing protein [Candidatus Limnocylindrales bacterium]
MTQQHDPGAGPNDETAAWHPTGEPDVAPAPAAAVAREGGTYGAETGMSRRNVGMRWAIALGGLGLVIAATVAIVALASGRPATSVAVGYMPPGTISYAEYRLDFPGDQRQKLASFLSSFPGFDDQAALDTKVREALDQILGLATDGEQLYSRDIEPWFGGTIAMGSGPMPAAEDFGAMSAFGTQLFVVTIKDAAIAADWVRDVLPDGAMEAQHGGATIFTTGAGFGAPSALAVAGDVMLGGSEATVRAAIDSNGDGDLAEDAEFQAALETVARDYVVFSYAEPRAMLQSYADLADPGVLDETTVDEELLLLVPTWTSTTAWLQDDAIASRTSYPSVDLGFDAANHASTLAAHVPATTIFYGETHDVGASLTAFLERLRALPDLQDGFRQLDQMAGMIGGIEGLIGWWGDAAIAVSELDDGSLGGGLLIDPTDAEAANRTFLTLRSIIGLAGGGVGIELRDVPHGDVTITVIDLSGAAGAAGGELPPGVSAEIAYAATDDLVVIGYGEEWVASVLDADGAALADDDRYESLLGRLGRENLGSWFVDITAIRELIEPIAESEAPADQWARYIDDIQPYILPFDAVVSAITKEGDLDRVDQILTVE